MILAIHLNQKEIHHNISNIIAINWAPLSISFEPKRHHTHLNITEQLSKCLSLLPNEQMSLSFLVNRCLFLLPSELMSLSYVVNRYLSHSQYQISLSLLPSLCRSLFPSYIRKTYVSTNLFCRCGHAFSYSFHLMTFNRLVDAI